MKISRVLRSWIKSALLVIAIVSPATAYSDNCSSVQREMVYGETAFKLAQDNMGYLNAAVEFEKATNIAPDCAMAYFNLGLVYEKAGDNIKAIKALRSYLSLSPKASDASEVQKKIWQLEYLEKDANKSVDWSIFNGPWCSKGVCGDSANKDAANIWRQFPERHLKVTINADSFYAKEEWIFVSAKHGPLETHKTIFTGKIKSDGTLSGVRTDGTIDVRGQSCPNIYVKTTLPFVGRLIKNLSSPLKYEIKLEWRKLAHTYDRSSCIMRRSKGRSYDISQVHIRIP